MSETPAKPTQTRIPLRPQPAQNPPAQASATPLNAVQFGQIARGAGHRITLYGPGGIGKTTLAAALPGPVGFIDLDNSLGCLYTSLKEQDLADGIMNVQGVNTWAELRAALRGPGWDQVKSIVIDSITLAEELAVKDVCLNIPINEKGQHGTRIEDFGFGKGYQHVYETFLTLLGDLDRHCRAGRNVCLIAHDCTATFPNPTGEDYIRFEPRLQSPNSGKGSIRHRVREWSDHLLYLGYDVTVDDKKARHSGSRTLWPVEGALCMAKSRTCKEPVLVQVGQGAAVWDMIIV